MLHVCPFAVIFIIWKHKMTVDDISSVTVSALCYVNSIVSFDRPRFYREITRICVILTLFSSPQVWQTNQKNSEIWHYNNPGGACRNGSSQWGEWWRGWLHALWRQIQVWLKKKKSINTQNKYWCHSDAIKVLIFSLYGSILTVDPVPLGSTGNMISCADPEGILWHWGHWVLTGELVPVQSH